MITLAQAKTVFSYDPETGLFTRLVGKAHNAKVGQAVRGTQTPYGYLVLNVNGKVMMAHRLAWLLTHGEHPPKGLDIDHINRDRADNRLANLRLLTRVDNLRNSSLSKASTSGHKGVTWYKPTGKWNAQIVVHGKRFNLGYYERIEDAVAARLEGERVHFGSA